MGLVDVFWLIWVFFGSLLLPFTGVPFFAAGFIRIVGLLRFLGLLGLLDGGVSHGLLGCDWDQSVQVGDGEFVFGKNQWLNQDIIGKLTNKRFESPFELVVGLLVELQSIEFWNMLEPKLDWLAP